MERDEKDQYKVRQKDFIPNASDDMSENEKNNDLFFKRKEEPDAKEDMRKKHVQNASQDEQYYEQQRQYEQHQQYEQKREYDQQQQFEQQQSLNQAAYDNGAGQNQSYQAEPYQAETYQQGWSQEPSHEDNIDRKYTQGIYESNYNQANDPIIGLSPYVQPRQELLPEEEKDFERQEAYDNRQYEQQQRESKIESESGGAAYSDTYTGATIAAAESELIQQSTSKVQATEPASNSVYTNSYTDTYAYTHTSIFNGGTENASSGAAEQNASKFKQPGDIEDIKFVQNSGATEKYNSGTGTGAEQSADPNHNRKAQYAADFSNENANDTGYQSPYGQASPENRNVENTAPESIIPGVVIAAAESERIQQSTSKVQVSEPVSNSVYTNSYTDTYAYTHTSVSSDDTENTSPGGAEQNASKFKQSGNIEDTKFVQNSGAASKLENGPATRAEAGQTKPEIDLKSKNAVYKSGFRNENPDSTRNNYSQTSPAIGSAEGVTSGGTAQSASKLRQNGDIRDSKLAESVKETKLVRDSGTSTKFDNTAAKIAEQRANAKIEAASNTNKKKKTLRLQSAKGIAEAAAVGVVPMSVGASVLQKVANPVKNTLSNLAEENTGTKAAKHIAQETVGVSKSISKQTGIHGSKLTQKQMQKVKYQRSLYKSLSQKDTTKLTQSEKGLPADKIKGTISDSNLTRPKALKERLVAAESTVKKGNEAITGKGVAGAASKPGLSLGGKTLAVGKGVIGGIALYGGQKLGSTVHGQISKYENDNAALKAAHTAEKGTSKLVRKAINRSKKQISRLKPRAGANDKSMVGQKLKFEKGAGRGKLAPAQQKRALLKKTFAKTYRKNAAKQSANIAERAAAAAQRLAIAARQMAARVTKFIISNIHNIAIGAAIALGIYLIFTILSLGVGIVVNILVPALGGTEATSDAKMADSTSYWTELCERLKIRINDEIPAENPGYDEYRFDVCSIADDPFQVTAFLSALYQDFSAIDVNPILEQVFNQEYTVTTEAITEIRTGSNADGSTYTYPWHVLLITCTSAGFTNTVQPILEASNAFGLYNAYIDTKGNRVGFGSPFSNNWYNSVASLYGWRQKVMTEAEAAAATTNEIKQREFHQGLDISADEGTTVRCISSGTVVSCVNNARWGTVVTIMDDYGYKEEYSLLGDIYVNPGNRVQYGDLVGAVGPSMDTLGTRLQIKISYNEQYLNPVFLMETGAGYITDYTDIPPEAASGGDFDRLMAVATQFIGYPYVWGGSTPQTSFDCSGFVCYVETTSGVHPVARTTAQGLYDACTPVPPTQAQPGDLVFFTGTYQATYPVTHVAIYCGNNTIIEAGDPIGYGDLTRPWYQNHFYAFGRLK